MHENAIELENGRVAIVNLKIKECGKTAKTKSRKIINLINGKILTNEKFFSIEVSPLKPLQLDYNEFTPLPLFTAVTWLSDTNLMEQNGRLPPSIEMADVVRQSTPVLTHLSCYKLSMDKFHEILQNEVSNVLALRGEYAEPNQPMKYAMDLVDAIKNFDESICIGVGGYPEVHPEAKSPESDLFFLKEKVDAGACFIITQTCFSSKIILKFIRTCRQVDITVPILPGVFIPFSFQSLIGMCKVCKVMVPEDAFQQFKKLRNDENAFQKFSVEYMVKEIENLFRSDLVCGVHFFTLNKFTLIQEVVSKLKF